MYFYSVHRGHVCVTACMWLSKNNCRLFSFSILWVSGMKLRWPGWWWTPLPAELSRWSLFFFKQTKFWTATLEAKVKDELERSAQKLLCTQFEKAVEWRTLTFHIHLLDVKLMKNRHHCVMGLVHWKWCLLDLSSAQTHLLAGSESWNFLTLHSCDLY